MRDDIARTVMAGVWAASELLERERQAQAKPRNLEGASQPQNNLDTPFLSLLHTSHITARLSVHPNPALPALS